jgi:hypothetical protein
MYVPTLSLDQERAKRLLGYMQEYRRSLLTQPPSAERNTIQRELQALQGRLIHESERERPSVIAFSVTREEAQTLKTMTRELCQLKAQAVQTDQIARSLIDLVGLKGVLERLYPSELRKHYTQSLSSRQEQGK